MEEDANPIVRPEVLRELGMSILQTLGVTEPDAAVTIDSLVDADLCGVHSHGVQRLRWYAERLRTRKTNPSPTIRVVSEDSSTAVVDGDAGLGQVVSHRAMSLALTKAQHSGIAAVSTRNSHHFGRCAYWAQMALPKDMIGIALTNGGPVMAPWGGLTPTTGNNPIGVAIPTEVEPAIILDMATSTISGGALDLAVLEGAKIPHGYALDSDGRSTDDPAAARRGLILPAGGHKGYGLTVIFEILTAALSGANLGREVQHPSTSTRPMNIGHFFQVIDVAHFLPVKTFKERVAAFIAQIRSSRVAPGVRMIYLPGELEHDRRARQLKEGIVLSRSIIAELNQLSEQMNCALRLP